MKRNGKLRKVTGFDFLKNVIKNFYKILSVKNLMKERKHLKETSNCSNLILSY